MKNKRFRIGAMATGFTVFFIAALVLFNLLAGIASDRFFWKWDITDAGLYEISSQTTDYLSKLTEPISVKVISTESVYTGYSGGLYTPIAELLKKYAAISGNQISVEFLDPDLNAGLLERYSTLSKLSSFDIIVESDRRYRILRSYDLLQVETNQETYDTSLTGYQAEQKLTSAVMHVSNEVVPHAAFLEGHGERSLSGLSGLLENSNYTTLSLNLPMEEIPDEVSLLVLAAPQLDYSPEEIEKLENYFIRGGDMWVLFDVGTNVPVLERFLADWGIAYQKEIVFDSVSARGDQRYVIPEMGTHEIATQIDSEGMMSLLYGGRPIELLFDAKGYRETHSLLTSSVNSYAKAYDASTQFTTYEKEANDDVGPFTVGAITEQTLYDTELNFTQARLVFLSINFADDFFLQEASLLNVRLMSSVATYCNPIQNTFYVEPRALPDSAMNVPLGAGMTMLVVLVILVPLAIFITGLMVWLRRRHL